MEIGSSTPLSMKGRKKAGAKLKNGATLPAWYLTKDLVTAEQKAFYRRVRVAFRLRGMEELAPLKTGLTRKQMSDEITRLLALAREHRIWVK